MRFFVQVTPIGKAEAQTYCVEADSWQKALQAARALRKENTPISGFSIELTDDGCRAIDPTARLRYVVKKAPANAALTTVDGVPLSKEPPATKNSAKPNASSTRPSNKPSAGTIGNGQAVAMRSESKMAVTASSASGASGTMTAVTLSAAAAAIVPEAPTTMPSLPPTDDGPHVLYRREEEASAESPLYYREDVYVMPEGTTEAAAERYLRQQLATIQVALATVRQGKYVNLAVFDRMFEGRPPVPPMVTLSWKDWRGNEPVVSYPRRGGLSVPASVVPTQPSAGSRAAPPMHQSASHVLAATAAAATASASSGTPPPSIAAIGEALQRLSQPPPPAGILALGAAIDRATSQPPPPPDGPIQPSPIVATAPSLPSIPSARPGSVPPPPSVVAPEPPESIMVAAPAETVANARPASVIPPSPIPAAGSPSSRPPPVMTGSVPSEPRQRISEGLMRISQGRQRIASRPSFGDGRPVRGDELIAVLFEAMHDLHFARDTLEAAAYCLHLAMEMIPSRAAFAHFYDIDKREYVLVTAVGAGTDPLILKRHPPTDPLLGAAMRLRTAVVVPDATKNEDAFVERFETIGGAKSLIVTPVMLGGRALAAIEIVNPVDGSPFNEAEGNAFTYMGEQFAEYVSSHGLVMDPERIKRTTPG